MVTELITSQSLHVRDGHPQDGEFVWFSGKGAAGGHHVAELVHVGRHLVPPATLYFAVTLPSS